jgi:hypothetical protein
VDEAPTDTVIGTTRRRTNHGKQIENRSREAEAEVFDAARAAVHALRAPAGGVSQVWHLPHLFPEAGRSRLDSWCS